ncbi:MAG TPA: hypothetical protein PKD90_02675 [Phnomibacter sp.]|nr:hypothetical protein [Phnomibacter sp.]
MSLIEFMVYFRYVSLGFMFFLFITKFLQIEIYKAKEQDYIPRKMLTKYNSIEVYGTDLVRRRKFMLRANKLTNWIYVAILLVMVAYALPYVVRIMGILS